MATTAKALVTLLEEACKDVSLSDEDTLKVADKLDGLGLKSVRDLPSTRARRSRRPDRSTRSK